MTARNGKQPAYALRDNHTDGATARAVAQARLDALRRGGGNLTLTPEPARPAVSEDSPLELEGFRGSINGRWIATRARNERGADGYLTHHEAEQEPPA